MVIKVLCKCEMKRLIGVLVNTSCFVYISWKMRLTTTWRLSDLKLSKGVLKSFANMWAIKFHILCWENMIFGLNFTYWESMIFGLRRTVRKCYLDLHEIRWSKIHHITSHESMSLDQNPICIKPWLIKKLLNKN